MKLPNWMPSKGLNASSPIAENANIRVIGDRGSGKTAYLASLAYQTRSPNRSLDSPIESINATGDQIAGNELIKFAQDILEQGLELEATKVDKNATVDTVKDYQLRITLKNQFSWNSSLFGSRPVQLDINCKDYSGEFFLDLINKKADPWLDDYLDDCKFASGILLLIDGTAYRMDALYAQGIENFFASLDHRQFDETPALKRIAVALNKCELPELWVNRHEAKELIKRRFPLTSQKLMRWDNNVRQVDFFTISAFGTLGKEFPEPNTTILKRDRGGTSCVIRKPKLWRPFGLVSPIYWLCTGKRHTTLDED